MMNEGQTPRIEKLDPKTLAGMHLTMSLADNRTFALWSSFMPRRKEILNAAGPDMFSMQVYGDAHDFSNVGFHAPFEKWAAVEVSSADNIPDGMDTFQLPGGLYAVFNYKGDLSGAAAMFRYIFAEWLPASGYAIDNRPHFELLGEKYKNNEPGSEEEIWIPVKRA